VLECLEEVSVDCRHYFGTDPWDLPAHRAIPMVAALPRFWTVIPETDPPQWRSAVRPKIERLTADRKRDDESELLSLTDLAELGLI
jgi:hypothetical protein